MARCRSTGSIGPRGRLPNFAVGSKAGCPRRAHSEPVGGLFILPFALLDPCERRSQAVKVKLKPCGIAWLPLMRYQVDKPVFNVEPYVLVFRMYFKLLQQ